MLHRPGIAAALLLSLIGAPSEAQQPSPHRSEQEAQAAARAASLDRLFESLREAGSPEVARGIELVIWSIWLNSGNEPADRLIAQAIDAMNSGDLPLARSRLDAAIALDPGFAEAWNKRATVYFLAGDYQRSLSDIDRVLAIEPRHFGALSGLGMIMDRLGRKEAALDAFRRALAIHPQMPAVQRRVEELTLEVEGQEL